ncbi:MAG: 30S ribosomal protein S3, partial [Candidatus Aminicenantes bacterium]|nr:30S ribosomal protein S3 [Candidatus Aminicenantes bacterium]
MGQKTHPHGFRLGFNKQWSSRWFARGTEYSRLVHEDLKMKSEIKKKYYHAGIAEVVIERVGPKIRAIIHTARPGIIIGRGGKEIESLKGFLEGIAKKEVYVDIREVDKPELASILVGELLGGYLANSLALLSDAGHVFVDILALLLSWFALRQTEKPASHKMTFGYHRIGILAALINSVSLVGIAGVIFYEAYG